MSNKINVGIVGVTGYTGMELVRILVNHSVFELSVITSRQEKGRLLQDVFPQFQGHREGKLTIIDTDPDSIAQKCTLVFLAVPHGKAMDIAVICLNNGLKVIDLSADFRLKSPEVYERWYNLPHRHLDTLDRAVYGLIELYSKDIAQSRLVANPGCYPTSIILGLYPVLAEKIIEPEDIIIDSKSGTSGAGRSAKIDTLFCEVYDNFKPYSLGKHRHTPEIEQELRKIANLDINISFNPHLLPIDRGMVSTMYTRPKSEISPEHIYTIFEKYYQDQPWIRILPNNSLPQTRRVRGTMYCDIAPIYEHRTKRLIIISAIDNLCRGASGQAIANANIMTQLEVRTGLDFTPLMP